LKAAILFPPRAHSKKERDFISLDINLRALLPNPLSSNILFRIIILSLPACWTKSSSKIRQKANTNFHSFSELKHPD